MDVYTARQPIFTRERTLFGYELLYDSPQSCAREMLSDSLLSVGWEHFSEGRKVCVPFSRELLVSGIEAIFPSDRLVVELGADSHPDAEVVAACEQLIEKGYEIGVGASARELLPFARYVSVDLDQPADRAAVRRLKEGGKTAVARQVTTRERFELALESGYDLFQGFFFAPARQSARPPHSHGQAGLHPSVGRITESRARLRRIGADYPRRGLSFRINC